MYNRIFGIGLPRTGGTTLASALRSFGIHGTNTCVVTNVTTESRPRKSDHPELIVKFDVNNMYPHYIYNLDYEFWKDSNNICEHDLFIMTTRDTDDWIASLNKHGHSEGSGSIPNKQAYESFIKANIPENQLLVIDWHDCSDTCWERLSKFLDKPLPKDVEFPCENC